MRLLVCSCVFEDFDWIIDGLIDCSTLYYSLLACLLAFFYSTLDFLFDSLLDSFLDSLSARRFCFCT